MNVGHGIGSGKEGLDSHDLLHHVFMLIKLERMSLAKEKLMTWGKLMIGKRKTHF